MKQNLYFLLVSSLMVVFAFQGCGKKISEQEYYDLAANYEKNGEFDLAAETYFKLGKRYPDGEHGAESLSKAALMYTNQLQEFEKAIDIHKRILRAFPDSKYAVQSMFLIGYTYANHMHDYEKAREWYLNFKEKYPHEDLASSVDWELENLGKDINELEFPDLPKPDSPKTE